MSLCVMSDAKKLPIMTNKCALKLIGINNSDLSEIEMLEIISDYVAPDSIKALVYDYFNNFYVLFLADIESVCHLVGRNILFKSHKTYFLPFLDYYIVDNVYPNVSNEELTEIFRTFGQVFSVSNHHVVPNSSKFCHVLSGKREISFIIPGKESEIYVPINVIRPPYSFRIQKLCCACLTEGHSILYCPDIEQDVDADEVDAIIKTEDIFESKELKCEDSPLNLLSSEENLKETTESIEDKIEAPIESSSQTSTIEMENIASSAVNGQDIVMSPDDINIQDTSLREIRTNSIWSPLAEDLIDKTMTSVEGSVLKRLLFFDGRLKVDIIEYTFSCLKDVSNLMEQLQKILLKCYEEKYSSLLGPFSRKIQTINQILSKYENESVSAQLKRRSKMG
ncbi:uncharacterized protein TNIN_457142 [Trichonephila inaurata madagascariensis]|uniref:Uncharacterized protein n=1 Tax=Trichonephila inaurata madagascariensis TaxID=2747483 RepID=A0A8X7BPF7_9ARAC|nr:uncharacterized protein TNIN_457142 [Trichonephila inaurata madagascariensis]